MTNARPEDVLASVMRHVAPSPVRSIAQAAQATGADFDYLLRTAARESNFDTKAEARTSSAAGMFQFIEQTWLSTFAQHGDKHGQGDLAKAITRDDKGRFVISDPQKRQDILDLRFDADLSSRLAGELTADNAKVLERALGRQPNGAELYMAHFLGAGSAAQLLETKGLNPNTSAADMFPAAASANRSIFYDQGRARSVSDVVEVLSAKHQGQSEIALAEPVRPVEPRMASTHNTAWTEVGLSRYPSSKVDGVTEISPLMIEILASLKGPDDLDPSDRA